MTEFILYYLFLGLITSALGSILLSILNKPVNVLGFIIDTVLWPLVVIMMIFTVIKGKYNAS